MAPRTAIRRVPVRPASAARAARIDSGLALYASLTTVTPSSRRDTSMRQRLRGPAADSAAATSAGAMPAASAAPAADRALATWCSPTTCSATGCSSPAATSVKRARAESSRRDPGGAHGGVVPRPGRQHCGAGAGRPWPRTRGSSALRTAVPSVGQRLDEFALGDGDPLGAAELAEVRGADVEHHADAGPGDPAEPGDVPGAAGAHLQHEEAGLLVGAEHGERQADVVVVGPGRADRRPRGGQHLAEQVLGRGLAGGAGDRQGRQPAGHQPGVHPGRQAAERLDRVG